MNIPNREAFHHFNRGSTGAGPLDADTLNASDAVCESAVDFIDVPQRSKSKDVSQMRRVITKKPSEGDRRPDPCLPALTSARANHLKFI